jgi:hypothetical protein
MMTARIVFQNGSHKFYDLKRFEMERHNPKDKYITLFPESGPYANFKLKELAEVAIFEVEHEEA